MASMVPTAKLNSRMEVEMEAEVAVDWVRLIKELIVLFKIFFLM